MLRKNLFPIGVIAFIVVFLTIAFVNVRHNDAKHATEAKRLLPMRQAIASKCDVALQDVTYDKLGIGHYFTPDDEKDVYNTWTGKRLFERYVPHRELFWVSTSDGSTKASYVTVPDGGNIVGTVYCDDWKEWKDPSIYN